MNIFTSPSEFVVLPRQTWTVVYRVGGHARYEWRRTVPQATFEEAVALRTHLQRAGYHGIIHETRELDIVGLPESWQ